MRRRNEETSRPRLGRRRAICGLRAVTVTIGLMTAMVLPGAGWSLGSAAAQSGDGAVPDAPAPDAAMPDAAMPDTAMPDTAVGRVTLVNAYAGQPIDILVGGRILVADLAPGQSQDLTPLAGQTLRQFEVRSARSTTALIGPVAELPVPAEQFRSWVVHQRPDGVAVLTEFEDDRTALDAGESRLTVRHVAPIGPAEVTASSGDVITPTVAFDGLSNGSQVEADVAITDVDRLVFRSVGAVPASAEVSDVSLRSGEQLVVYLYGGTAELPLSCFSLVNAGLAAVPNRVDTGFGPLPRDEDAMRWPAPTTVVLTILMSMVAAVLATWALERDRPRTGAAGDGGVEAR